MGLIELTLCHEIELLMLMIDISTQRSQGHFLCYIGKVTTCLFLGLLYPQYYFIL